MKNTNTSTSIIENALKAVCTQLQKDTIQNNKTDQDRLDVRPTMNDLFTLLNKAVGETCVRVEPYSIGSISLNHNGQSNCDTVYFKYQTRIFAVCCNWGNTKLVEFEPTIRVFDMSALAHDDDFKLNLFEDYSSLAITLYHAYFK